MNDDSDSVLEGRLRTATRFGRLLHIASCESTQDVALTETGSICVWADGQTAGRGRRGRIWDGAASLDVEMTLRVEGLELSSPELLAPSIPCGVVVALESLCGERLTMKWPNDVQHRGRKLSGILIDAHGSVDARAGRTRTFLIGIGVNVNRIHFPPELAETATSIAQIAGRHVDRHEVVARIASAIEHTLHDLGQGRLDRIESVFRSRLGVLGGRVEARLVGEDDRAGVVTAIDLRSISIDRGAPIPLVRVDGLRPA